MNKKINWIFATLFLLASCSSIQQPQSIETKLDYTDIDVIENEKKNILQMQEKEPVKAMYRASFIQDKDFLLSCSKDVEEKLDKAFEEKDFISALRYSKSLETLNLLSDEKKSQVGDLYAEFEQAVPGLKKDEEKKPSNIQDCINATATVWVDRGIKVENGAGFNDIIIGSGFFIDRRGYLITNHHVIDSMVNPKEEGYSRLYIKLPSDSDTKIPAKVVGYDPVIDLALLKVEIEPDFVLELGSSKDLSVGTRISAIGTPLGLEGTLTSGIISSVDRKLTTMGNVFQLDAAVNSGNSGGPIIDEAYKVQAIVFAGMLQYQGLNFAIPVEYLKQELPLLYKGGKITHTWISSYGHTKKVKSAKNGLEVQYTMPGGSGTFSGLKADDVIIELDGQKISSLEDFQFVCMKYEAGTILPCKYLSDEEEKESVVYLEQRGESPCVKIYKSDFISDSFIPIFGMELVHSSTTNKKSYRINKVINGSTADESGFSENDTIVIHDIKFDNENKYLMAQVFVQRRKKGFLDAAMILYASYDNPYYF